MFTVLLDRPIKSNRPKLMLVGYSLKDFIFYGILVYPSNIHPNPPTSKIIRPNPQVTRNNKYLLCLFLSQYSIDNYAQDIYKGNTITIFWLHDETYKAVVQEVYNYDVYNLNNYYGFNSCDYVEYIKSLRKKYGESFWSNRFQGKKTKLH